MTILNTVYMYKIQRITYNILNEIKGYNFGTSCFFLGLNITSAAALVLDTLKILKADTFK